MTLGVAGRRLEFPISGPAGVSETGAAATVGRRLGVPWLQVDAP